MLASRFADCRVHRDKYSCLDVGTKKQSSQVLITYELKKDRIDADSIYGFLGAFNEGYSECTDAEKKQFMQAFIERIDIFPERREDGNWIQNIKFQFPVPIIKEGKEVAQIKGISLDNEKSDEHMISLEKLSTLHLFYHIEHPIVSVNLIFFYRNERP